MYMDYNPSLIKSEVSLFKHRMAWAYNNIKLLIDSKRRGELKLILFGWLVACECILWLGAIQIHDRVTNKNNTYLIYQYIPIYSRLETQLQGIGWKYDGNIPRYPYSPCKTVIRAQKQMKCLWSWTQKCFGSIKSRLNVSSIFAAVLHLQTQASSMWPI